jgi:uncharacterized protein (TIGR01777 family)
MRALVTGATGFIGRRLMERLEGPVLLGRGRDRLLREFAAQRASAYEWDSLGEPVPAPALEDVDTVFNLAGEPVAGRWNEDKKKRILDSRAKGTRRLVEAMAGERPKVLVCASAVGYYGSRGDVWLDESAPAGKDFLADVCVAWEREAEKAAALGVRVVRLRIGLVIGPGGGALAQMITPFKLGLGGPLGDGRQWMPWIHLEDLVSLMIHAAEHEDVSGAVNGVAPNPVTNAEFTKTLAAALNRPAFLPAPQFLLRLVFGEFAQYLFASQRVRPKAATDRGFRFEYPEIRGALSAIL